MKYVKMRVAFGLGVFILLLALMGCRPEGGEQVRINPQRFDAAQENLIGARLLTDLDADGEIRTLTPDDDRLSDSAYYYLTPLLRSVARQPAVTRRDSFAWEVRLIEDTTARVYTLPGGRIVLHTGLLRRLDSEAELVGMLAREVAFAQTGASMRALDRAVEDNVVLGDLILGNAHDTRFLLRELPGLHYTLDEVAAADQLVTDLICNSDYEELALTQLVDRLGEDAYRIARPTVSDWKPAFTLRVATCPGADSSYVQRYRRAVDAFLPVTR